MLMNRCVKDILSKLNKFTIIIKYMETLKGDEWGSKDLYKTKRMKGLVN